MRARGLVLILPHIMCSAWSVYVLLAGRPPPGSRPDGQPFGPGDEARLALPGQKLAFRGLVLWAKGYLTEFARTLACPSWYVTDHPCLACRATQDTMLARSFAANPGEFPWP